MDRFWSKAEKTDGCWLWTAATQKGGYGRFRLNGRLECAHRVSYELTKGDIPEGLQIDHLCRNASCVNPDHLEAVSQQENIKRGEAGLYLKERTHCPSGHEYSSENTYVDPKGHRFCRKCSRNFDRKRRGYSTPFE